jgi:hypothetical protein
MQNHLHLVLRARPDVVRHWSDADVVRRWLLISRLVHSKDGHTVRAVTDEQIAVQLSQPGRVDELRGWLCDVSQFMKALCEHTARRANREDKKKGAFFESRFKCRELLGEGPLLLCGIYVDLNQIRAGETKTPEQSTHTSAYERIAARQCGRRAAQPAGAPVAAAQVVPSDGWMCELVLDERAEAYDRSAPSASGRRASDKGLLPIQLDDYLSLLDWTGREVHADKRGAIPAHLAPILERLKISRTMWVELVTEFDRWFSHVVGSSDALVDRAATVGRRWYHGRARCAEAFG